MKIRIHFALLLLLISCTQENKKSVEKKYATIGSIERYSNELDQIIRPTAKIEILAKGFIWAEGPVWIDSGNYLLFSDIPRNSIYKWSEKDSITLYLKPSGYTDTVKRGGEMGSNALLISPQGKLVLCQHGNRQMAVMNAPVNNPKPDFITLASKYNGKRLNSPNDGVFDSMGDLYFTDPPYGLEKGMDDPSKELDFQGVYRLSVNGVLKLFTKELSRPNGIGFSPDGKTLYVSNSDADHAVWMAYEIDTAGQIQNERIFYDATEKAKTEQGLPDGLKVSRKGYLFGAGPGGIWIFNPQGTPIGKINTTITTANCAFDSDEGTLYITADMYLLRVKLK